MSKLAFLVKNLFDYETVIPPPQNLPGNLHSIYLTDTTLNADKALALGWNEAIVTRDFLDLELKQQRRLAIGYINAYPGKFIHDADKFDIVFLSDSNIIRMFDEYRDFVNACDIQNCLFVTSGYYQGHRDNIIAECAASLQPRWHYFHESMKNRVQEYCEFFKQNSIDVNHVSVCSAKYFAWNLKHPSYTQLSTEFYQEQVIHQQGNIILSYLAQKYPQLIQEYKLVTCTNGAVAGHNYDG